MNKEIELSADDWDKFYEIKGSRFFQLESQILGAHGEDIKKLLYEILKSTTRLIQVIGVVAGFGFTGLGYVKNLSLFIIGESILLLAILIGLYWIQKTYKSNFESTSREIERVKNLFSKRNAVFRKIYDEALSKMDGNGNMRFNSSLASELTKEDLSFIENYQSKEVKSKEWDPLSLLMVLFAIGGLGLLLSFIYT